MSGCLPSTVSPRDGTQIGGLARPSQQPNNDFKVNMLPFLLISRDTFSVHILLLMLEYT